METNTTSVDISSSSTGSISASVNTDTKASTVVVSKPSEVTYSANCESCGKFMEEIKAKLVGGSWIVSCPNKIKRRITKAGKTILDEVESICGFEHKVAV